MDLSQLIRELLIGLRATASQGEVGLRLATDGDQIYRWESGHAAIGWKDFIRLCEATQTSLSEAVRQMLGYVGDPKDFQKFVVHLIRERPQSEIASLVGVSRSVISRWQNGASEPSLEQVFKLIQVSRYNLSLFLTKLVSPEALPSLKSEINRLETERRLCFEHPWMPAVFQVLTTAAYIAEPHKEGFIAETVGVTLEDEGKMIQNLTDAGSIRWNGTRYEIVDGHRNFGGDYEGNRRVREYWTRRSLSYIESAKGPTDGVTWGCAVIHLSADAYNEATQAYSAFLQKLNSITSADKGPSERITLLNMQFIDIRKLPKIKPHQESETNLL